MRDGPADPQWPIALAYTTRCLDSIDAAKPILLGAAAHNPDDAIIHYNLGCYDCQLGNLAGVKGHLKRAFELAPKGRESALEDTDLKPPWQVLHDQHR